MKSDDELNRAGFTESGKNRFKNTIISYSEELFNKSVSFGNLDKAPSMNREVTHDHVRSAAPRMMIKDSETAWQKFCHFLQYSSALAAGAGASNLQESWGLWVFVCSLSIGVGAYIFRIQSKQS